MAEIIFFGNGPLADYARAALEPHHQIVAHIHTVNDLASVPSIKKAHPQAYGVLASFGVLIKSDILELFDPIGILNIHPSKLPFYRGASPIEAAILAGDQDFSVSIMQLVAAMDAGPVYHQITLHLPDAAKAELYQKLATAGAEWLAQNLEHLPTPRPQDNSQATFCGKLNPTMSLLAPESKTALELHNQVRAFQGYPKSRYTFFEKDCIILDTHIANSAEHSLSLQCQDGQFLVIDQLQPAGKKPMDAKSFLNGYAK